MQQKESPDLIIPASAAILTGGKSTRFGSDKAFMKFNRRSVSSHLFNLFTQIFQDVFFVSNEEKALTNNQKLFIDIYKDKGPLGGLYTALKNAGHPYCFITACDTPFINNDLIKLLWQKKNNADAVIPVWGGKAEPLAAFYNVKCIEKIELLIEFDNLSLKNLISELDIEKTELDNLYSEEELKKLFLNINTAENFEKAKGLWS